jgi:hypothetical protein
MKVLLHSRLFSYVSSSIHNPTQELLSRMYFGPVCDLSLDPTKRNKVGLGPEISAAKVLDHDNKSNHFRADSAGVNH